MNFAVLLGIFTAIFGQVHVYFGVALGIFTEIFEVTSCILTGMFWATSGEFWGDFGHYFGIFHASSGEFWVDFGHFYSDFWASSREFWGGCLHFCSDFWGDLELFNGDVLGNFRGILGCLWTLLPGCFGQVQLNFGVTVGIFTGMFRASSGEVWRGFGHFYIDFWGDFRHFYRAVLSMFR